MTSRLNWISALVLTAVAVVGCNKSNDNGGSASTGGAPTTQASAGGNEKPLHLAFVTNNASDYWTIARAGTEAAQKELTNVSVDFTIPSDGTAEQQKRLVDDLLARGEDGIAISPVDPTNETPMLNQVAKQTLLFTQDSDAPNSDRACYVGTDNVAAGRQAGDLVKQAIPNGGKIMVFVGTLDAANAHERYQGLQEALKGSNVSIIDVRTDDTDRVRAKGNVQDTLTKYPDVACLVGLWSYNGPEIYNAVKEAGKAGQVKIVCFDQEDEALAGVKDGTIFATVVQQPYEFGRQCMILMTKYLRGDHSVIPPSKQIFIPTMAVTSANIDQYTKDLNKMRGRG